MSIDFECNFIQLQGDIVITFFDGKFSRVYILKNIVIENTN